MRYRLAVLFLLMYAPAFAQPPADPRAFIALKGGTMHENAEDGLRQTSGALGLAAGIPVGQRWILEAEFVDNGLGSPDHRETLFSVSALRSFGDTRLNPYAAIGVTFGRNEETLTSCIADRVPFGGGGAPVETIVDCSEPDVRLRLDETATGGTTFLLAGAGISIPLGGRLRLIPELRAHLSPTAAIVRPGVALAVVF